MRVTDGQRSIARAEPQQAFQNGRAVGRAEAAGIVAQPGTVTGSIGVYAGKFAVEGLTEALALEYGPLNIRFKTVAPGAYPTTRFGDNTDSPIDAGGEELSAYARELREQIQAISQRLASQDGAKAHPREVADRIYECATSDTPVHNPVGKDAEMLVGMMNGADSRQAFLDQLEAMLAPQADT